MTAAGRLGCVVVMALFTAYTMAAQEVLRDTSYTVYGTWVKIRSEYPLAVPVPEAVPPEVSVRKNLVYARYGSRSMLLDLYMPAPDSLYRAPLVLLVHGGGWRSGDRTQMVPLAVICAKRGYAAAAVEYRLSGEAKYPAGIDDLKEAIRWARANAASLDIDGGRIAIVGCSAGGTLAAMVAATGDRAGYQGRISNGGTSAAVQAVVDMDGILDFTDPAESGKDSDPSRLSAGARWLGGTYKEKPEVWREASPVNHITGEMPPILFVNSSVPRFHAGRDEAIRRLEQLGIYSEVHTIPDSPHSFWLFHPWFEPAAGHIIEFLGKIFGNKAPQSSLPKQ